MWSMHEGVEPGVTKYPYPNKAWDQVVTPHGVQSDVVSGGGCAGADRAVAHSL